jgi:prepilin-type N-terminal cleavage/methylation domain-containing protein
MNNNKKGFTIVELLIVIVVIGILAAITIIAFNGVQQKAVASSMQSDLDNASKQLKIDQVTTGSFPTTVAAANNGQGLKVSANTTYRYTVNNATNPQTFCLTAVNGSTFYMITDSSTPAVGSCANVAQGATVTSSSLPSSSSPGSLPLSIITDGVTTSTSWIGPVATGLSSMTVDLGSAQLISSIKVWHYYADGRSYSATKTEVSTDNTNWTTIYDSAVSGTYPETSAGKTFTFAPLSVRYIRDWLNGSTSNPANHWVEIQAY